MNKHAICGLLLAACTLQSVAQSSTKSPYSQFGLGVLSDESQAASRGMNGVGIGLRQGKQANVLNPASYSAVDSLTMLFDMGLSGQLTNFKEGSTRVNGTTASFEYAVGCFRLLPHVGMAFGVLPYSNVGYDYSSSTFLDTTNGTITESYEGSGGTHQAFAGMGWRIFGPLSVGVNAAYFWGTLDRSVTSSNNTYVSSLKKSYTATIHSYKIDLGLQWQQPIGKKDQLVVGATLGLGHKLGADATCEIENVTNADTTTFVVADAYELPTTIGVGASWSHGDKWTVAADLTMQKWGSIDFPAYADGTYTLKSGLLKDRYKANVGGEWTPNAMSRNLMNRIHYRAGFGFATPYYNIKGQDGPKEMSVSAGLGIPLQNTWNNRSVLNISAQWARTSATGFITENTFRINIGLTFNEAWFAKWKIE